MLRASLLAALLAVAVGVPASAARVQPLYAWAANGHLPIVGVSKTSLALGRADLARHVAPGRYRVYVAAQPDLAFHLRGPGIDRQTHFVVGSYRRVYETWTIRLRRGRYRYSGEGLYAQELRAAGVRIGGFFRVP
jgi:hypothetical protein